MFSRYLLETCYFLMKERKGVDLEGMEGGEELGGDRDGKL